MLANANANANVRPVPAAKAYRPSPLFRFSTSVIGMLKAQPSEAEASVLPASESRPLSDSPTSSVTSLPLVPSAEPPKEKEKDDVASRLVVELRRKLQDAEATIATRDQSVASLQEQEKALNASLEEARSEVEVQKTAVELLKDEKSAVEKSRADIQQQLTSIHEDFERCRVELTDARRERDDARADVSAKTAETEAEHSACITVGQQLEAVLAEKRGLEATNLQIQSEFDAKITELQNLSVQTEDLASKFAALQAESDRKTSRIEELEVDLEASNQEREAIDRQRIAAVEQVHSLEGQLEEETTAVRRGMEELQRREEDLRVSQDIAHDLQVQLQEMRTAADRTEQFRQSLELELHKTRQCASEALNSALHECEMLKAQVNEARQRAVAAERAVDEARRRMKQARDEDPDVLQLRSELVSTRIAFSTLRDQFRVLSRHATNLEEAARRRTQESGCVVQ
ncbi:uncharacterized protein LAESUDRAFT_810890 [Laetiporus sulphureus 93-53]|uniref:Uncharacterized protein n=1 Tax=Laetiporus sulphureus 93-53 TaxID=1314785 RepID=A0A165FPE5_9APHY|nr:uncharacterized protein LAESUDRAFT_810890 [Laetiporus sulphureus 93-53]KZT09275.1 hypothetical protein LAESUDRAFT_810890 [Laetiporus sulphureus 93-53]